MSLVFGLMHHSVGKQCYQRLNIDEISITQYLKSKDAKNWKNHVVAKCFMDNLLTNQLAEKPTLQQSNSLTVQLADTPTRRQTNSPKLMDVSTHAEMQ